MESKRSWTVRPSAVVPLKITEACSGHSYLAEALVQRGFQTYQQARSFLEPDHYIPAPASELAGVREGAALLKAALEEGQKFLIWGDFDADGQTSTALLASALKRLAKRENDVHWHVPHRLRDNHGVQADRLQELLNNPCWQADILITCDTGIDAVEGLALARASGLSIIVTDHHDLPPNFGQFEIGCNPVLNLGPDSHSAKNIRSLADVIVNPKLMDPGHAQSALPGVGVAFLLIKELYSLLNKEEEITAFLDLVAIGIVADVAEQVGDTRYWLQRGMAALNQTERPGIIALLKSSRANLGSLRTEDISFLIAPKMNAAGRMADASVTVELMLTDDPVQANALAATLNNLNEERKVLTGQMLEEAMAQLEYNPDLKGQYSIVLAHKSWHPGILGLVASRVTETYGLPTVLLQIQNDNTARGSARSIEGVNIGAALEECHKFLYSSGGHAQAAGLSLNQRKLPDFRQAFDKAVAAHTDDADNSGDLVVDRSLKLEEVNRHLWNQLQRLEPTGKGNPEFLCLSTNLIVEKWRKVGRGNSSMLRFQVRQRGNPFPTSAVWFRCPLEKAPTEPIDLVSTLRLSHYKDNSNVELLVHSWRLHRQREAADPQPQPEFPFQIVDLRAQTPPESPEVANSASIWYAEGLQLNPKQLCTRFELASQASEERKDASHLVVWSSPPSRQVLRLLLNAKSWNRITLMAHEQPLPSAFELPPIIYAMCRYAARAREGTLQVPLMAAKLGLTESIVKLCLTLLVDQGIIKTSGETVEITSAEESTLVSLDRTREAGQRAIVEALQEIRSFRLLYKTEKHQYLLV